MKSRVRKRGSHKKQKETNAMILYFSGTGNSEYTAKRIGEEINDEIMNLGEKIRSRDFSGIHSDTPWVWPPPPTRGESPASCRNGWKKQN